MRSLSQRENSLTNAISKKSRYQDFVGVVASVWLERERGKHLQGKGSSDIINKYARKGELDILKALPIPTPIGYQAEGAFYL